VRLHNAGNRAQEIDMRVDLVGAEAKHSCMRG
jgi:hypothetical protein